jgi:hypothetical protein
MLGFSILCGPDIQKLLRSVAPAKLLRVYAMFSVDGDGPWFKDVPKTTTDSFLRQIIPVCKNSGLIMLSYSDGRDVDFFLKGGGVRRDLKELIMGECHRLFPRQKIPDPLYFNHHYWSEGTHYWRKNTDSSMVSRTLVNPVDDVFICGEGFSTKQCWIEGALQTSQSVVSRIEKGHDITFQSNPNHTFT